MTNYIHGTCVALDYDAVLLTGPPGVGKSDLALRLIDRGFMLVADDQVEIIKDGTVLKVQSPVTIAGQIEARGIGILSMPHQTDSVLRMAVKLVPRGDVERLPEPDHFHHHNISIPQFRLCAFDHSTPLKIALALSEICHKLKAKRD